MDPTTALLAGLVAGLAIAVQVGAVSLLLIEASITAGPRAGVAAGMGVATADFAFAVVAAAAGGAAGAVLASHEAEIKVIAALTLATIAIHGLVRLRREAGAGEAAREPGRGDARLGRGESADEAGRGDARGEAGRGDARGEAGRGGGGAGGGHYGRFLAITAANPLTI